jgi:2-phosphosulfolactate phosphatase
MPLQSSLKVAFLPQETGEIEGKILVLIDVLRTSTTVVELLSAGARRIYLTSHLTESTRDQVTGKPLILGEQAVGGLPGVHIHADAMPSPAALEGMEIQDRDVILSTVNGAPAAELVMKGRPRCCLVVGLTNRAASVSKIQKMLNKEGNDIVIVCSGRKATTHITLDDIYTAGSIISRLLKLPSTDFIIDDSVKVAQRIFENYSSPLAALQDSDTADLLYDVGNENDIEFCSRLDVHTIVPELKQSTDGMIYCDYEVAS